MNAVPEEAREAYVEEIVVALQSENSNDLQSNVSRIVQWIGALAWQKKSRVRLRKLIEAVHGR